MACSLGTSLPIERRLVQYTRVGGEQQRSRGIVARPSPAVLEPTIRPHAVALASLASALVAATILACGGDASEEVPALELVPILGGQHYDEPVEVGAYPGGRLFVAEQAGRVLLASDEAPEGTVLLDITDRTDSRLGEGVMSVALDPAFAENGQLWVYYFVLGDPERTLLSRFTVVDGVADAGSELVVLEVLQPGYNQNGGAIRFGPGDRMLYLSLGDGSASADPFENGQNLGTVLGAVIRIDVRESSVDAPYAIPEDNPFVNVAGARPEIWAYGLRNPWRMTIDEESGEVWLGDVQVSTAEEVNRVEAGDNLGWPIMEGDGCLTRAPCDPTGLVTPVATFPHGEGRCAVIGGVVYRGDAVRALEGRYLYGDLCTGAIWAIERDGQSPPELLTALEGQLVSFGTDGAGEVLVVDLDGGGIFRLQAAD